MRDHGLKTIEWKCWLYNFAQRKEKRLCSPIIPVNKKLYIIWVSTILNICIKNLHDSKICHVHFICTNLSIC